MKLCKFLCWCLLLFGAVYVIECAVKKHNGGATRRRMQSDEKRVESFDASSESVITSARIHKSRRNAYKKCYKNTDREITQKTCHIKSYAFIYCFEFEYYEQSLWKFERGCCKELSECNSFCNTKKKSYTVGHCNTCHTSMCNKKYMIGFACFIDDNFKMRCWSKEVCYTIMMHQYQTDKSLTVARGCVKTDRDDRDYCNEVQLEIKKQYSNATFPRGCNFCYEHSCNNDKYIARYCYVCNENSTACNTVDRQNTQTNITLLECCTIITFFDRNKGGMWRERGLVDEFKTGDCTTYCGNHKTAIKCDYCQDSFCNKIEFKPLPVGVVCKKCNTVNLKTVTKITVPYQRCCYVAVIKNITGDTYFVKRDCLFENNTECKDVCKDVTNVYECEACQDNGLMKHCNAGTKIPKIHCYQCNGIDCNEIDKNKTKVVECESLCCYSYSKFSKKDGRVSWRDCCDGPNANYKNYCANQTNISKKHKAFEIQNCRACNDRKCNSQKLPRKFYCYNCTECNTVNKKLAAPECISSDCCYNFLAQTELYQPVYMVRRCAEWKPYQNCTNESNRKAAREFYEVVQNCTKCTSGNDRCNNLNYTVPSIKCYNCNGKDCWNVTKSKAADCKMMCCIAISTFDGNGRKYFRKCAENTKDCLGYCKRYRDQYEKVDVECQSCAEDKCNKKVFIQNVHCLKCDNCNSVNNRVKLIPCKSHECCYTAHLSNIKTEPLTTARGCRNMTAGSKCNQKDTCEHVKTAHATKHRHSSFGNCTTCSDGDATDGCNNLSYTPPSIKCHVCKDSNCIGVPNVNQASKCEYMCCYQMIRFGDDGFKYERGCAKEIRACDSSYCVYYEMQLNESTHNNNEVVKCTACPDNSCNNMKFEPFKCYQCDKCNSVSNETELIDCINPRCCYVAIVRELEFEPYFARRGCLDWQMGVDCRTTCEQIENNDTDNFQSCTTCNEDDSIGCNDQLFEQPSIDCYKCTNCSTIESGKTKQTKCVNMCCYTHTGYSAEGLYVVRDCCEEMRLDNTYCINHRQTFDDLGNETYDYLTCDSCEGNLCNGDILQKRLLCYNCKRCNMVVPSTNLIECFSHSCCYTAHLKYKDNEEHFAVRGCLAWSQGLQCDANTTCALVEETHKTRHTGQFVKCTTCDDDDKNKCNNVTYTPPRMCFDCQGDHCTTVTSDTQYLPCPSSWCYAQTVFRENVYHTDRGCVPNDGGGERYCAGLEDLNSDQLDMVILDCKSCSEFNCNNETLRPRFQCYTCAYCNNLTNTALLDDCIHPTCCYTAQLQETPYQNFFARRGCAAADQYDSRTDACDATCTTFLSKFKDNQPDGAFLNCTTCNENDTSKCNDEAFLPPPICYKCSGERCFDVSENKVLATKCPNQTCYSATTFSNSSGKNVRDCADAPCTEFETKWRSMNAHLDIVEFHCCTGFKCNRNKLKRPAKCVKCAHCNVVKNPELVPCRSSECCYIAYTKYEENQPFFAARGCATWKNPQGCTDLTTDLEKELMKDHPDADVGGYDACKVDAIAGCNNASFDPDSMVIPLGPPSVACYKCKRCNEVSYGTKLTRCAEPSCCYRAAVRDKPGHDMYANRGCITLRHGQTCQDICKDVRRHHMLGYPKGSFLVCMTYNVGDGDGCNHHEFILRRDITIETEPMRCLNCTDCDETTSTTDNMHCRSPECCYTATLKTAPYGVTYVVRGCDDWYPEFSCGRTCEYLAEVHKKRYPHGVVVTCFTCKEDAFDECNNFPLHRHEVSTIADMPEILPNFECYSCTDCNVVNMDTATVPCQDKHCCYQALVNEKPNNTIYTVRGCVKLKAGQLCGDACQYVRDEHHLRYTTGSMIICRTCRADDGEQCNDEAYNAPPEDVTVEPVTELNLIQCYECTNCSEVSPGIATIGCHKADCCYTIYVKDHKYSPYYAVRNCYPFRPDMSCSATCDLLQNQHLWDYPLGEFYKCIPCLSDDEDLCNDYAFYPPITTTTARHRRPYGFFACYKCENCPIITASTDVVECISLDCCYAALVKYNKEDSDSVVIRGCSSPDLPGNCKDACADVGTNHLWYHTNGKFVNCTVCVADASNECNSATFSQPSA